MYIIKNKPWRPGDKTGGHIKPPREREREERERGER